MGLYLVRHLKVRFVWSITMPIALVMVHNDVYMVIVPNIWWFHLSLSKDLLGGIVISTEAFRDMIITPSSSMLEVVLPIPKSRYDLVDVAISHLEQGIRILDDSTWYLILQGSPQMLKHWSREVWCWIIDDVPCGSPRLAFTLFDGHYLLRSTNDDGYPWDDRGELANHYWSQHLSRFVPRHPLMHTFSCPLEGDVGHFRGDILIWRHFGGMPMVLELLLGVWNTHEPIFNLS